MSDTPPGPAELDAPADETPATTRLPVGFRILGGVGVAALLVGLYAVVQFTSGDDPAPPQSVSSLPFGQGEAPRAGAVAPDFTVPTLDGGSFSLSSHLADDGRPVLVNMWAEWCFPCRAEMPAIDAASEAHPGIHFIGVVVRDREAPARKFVEEYGISYQIGLDTNGAVERDYLVWVMPSTYLIGADGLVIERFFGPMNEAQLDELLAGAASTDI